MRCIFLAAALCLPGCILPYAVPSVSYVPPFDLECPAGEVRAFRVDITRSTVTVRDTRVYEIRDLKEVGVDGSKKTLGQMGAACTHGFCMVWPQWIPDSTSHSLAVRLYRPGYETVELNSWNPRGKVIWKPALTAAVQEIALDDLFDLGEKNPACGEDGVAVHRSLEPGSKSTAHRNALRFGAAEYARLAGQVAGQDGNQRALRDRLVDKARRLEQLADNKAAAQAGP